MSKSVRLVFFGNERLATAVDTTAPILRGLINEGYEIKAVIASYTAGQSRSDRRLEIVEVAHAYHIPVLLPAKLSEVAEKIQDYGAEAAVLVAYGKIIPQAIIDIFPKGIINAHPSLLPLYRGPTPIETAILCGASQTGVSLMQLTAKMDAGPVFDTRKLNLSGDESKQLLTDKLSTMGAEMLVKNLPAILQGSAKATAQDETKVSYTKLFKKEDSIMDWSRPAEQLERQVRAYAGWPKSTATVSGQKIIVTKARVAAAKDDGALVVKCNPGHLEILELIAPSGRKMSGADFLRGYQP
jgi:methionyl-tRNA formyltransferase